MLRPDGSFQNRARKRQPPFDIPPVWRHVEMDLQQFFLAIPLFQLEGAEVSRILADQVRGFGSIIRAICILMVDPPGDNSFRAQVLVGGAREEKGLTPGCQKKPAVFIKDQEFLEFGRICSSGVWNRHFSSTEVKARSRRPLRSKTRVAVGR